MSLFLQFFLSLPPCRRQIAKSAAAAVAKCPPPLPNCRIRHRMSPTMPKYAHNSPSPRRPFLRRQESHSVVSHNLPNSPTIPPSPHQLRRLWRHTIVRFLPSQEWSVGVRECTGVFCGENCGGRECVGIIRHLSAKFFMLHTPFFVLHTPFFVLYTPCFVKNEPFFVKNEPFFALYTPCFVLYTPCFVLHEPSKMKNGRFLLTNFAQSCII